jgi:hypothetical protein
LDDAICENAYLRGFATDLQGLASNLIALKLICGGAWEEFENDCRSAKRTAFGVSPFLKDYILGFRVVLACP